MRFTWDTKKAKSNLKRHGVSFEEAAEAIASDANAQHDYDLDADEPRLRTLAYSPRGRVLFVVTVEREVDTLRIVSARKASAQEVARYHAQS